MSRIDWLVFKSLELVLRNSLTRSLIFCFAIFGFLFFEMGFGSGLVIAISGDPDCNIMPYSKAGRNFNIVSNVERAERILSPIDREMIA